MLFSSAAVAAFRLLLSLISPIRSWLDDMPGVQVLAYRLATEANAGCYILDPRGTGRSGGPRGDAKSKAHVWSDVRTLVRLLKHRYPELPTLLLGWSWGGVLAVNYATWQEAASVDGIVLLSSNLLFPAGFRSDGNMKRLFSYSHKHTLYAMINKLSGRQLLVHRRVLSMNKTVAELLRQVLNPNVLSDMSPVYASAIRPYSTNECVIRALLHVACCATMH